MASRTAAIWSGCIGSPSVKVRPNGLPKDVPEEKTLEQIGRAIRECAQAATEAGVRIQLEVHGAETQRVPRIVKMLNYANNQENNPYVGLITEKKNE